MLEPSGKSADVGASEVFPESTRICGLIILLRAWVSAKGGVNDSAARLGHFKDVTD